VFDRDSNEDLLRKIDTKFSEADGKIIICRRSNYEGIKDDLHDYVDSSALKRLDEEYEKFSMWTSCKVLVLNVDDENLEREIQDIRSWLNL